jgi:hypothetical protein
MEKHLTALARIVWYRRTIFQKWVAQNGCDATMYIAQLDYHYSG